MNEELQLSRNKTGSDAEKNGDIDLAIRLYEQNVAEKFDGSHPYTRLSVIYRKQKRYKDEIRVLKAAIRVFKKVKRSDGPQKLQKYQDRLAQAEALYEKTKG